MFVYIINLSKKHIVTIVLFAAISFLSCVNPNDKERFFTVISLPDTQNYMADPGYYCIFQNQINWIIKNKEKLNIVFVAHEGDITDDNGKVQWKESKKIMNSLSGIIPFSVTTGNHDIDYGNNKGRNTKMFNQAFPVSMFSETPDSKFVGSYKNSSQNSYYNFEIMDMKFMVLTLEFGPRDEVLQWADEVVQANQDRRVFLVTHSYMYADNTRVDKEDCWNALSYMNEANVGEQVYEKFVSKHDNIFLVLNGHILGDGTGRLTSIRKSDTMVHQILANYQMKENAGNGWLRIHKFVPSKNRIYVTTYTPLYGGSKTDKENQFELKYNMN